MIEEAGYLSTRLDNLKDRYISHVRTRELNDASEILASYNITLTKYNELLQNIFIYIETKAYIQSTESNTNESSNES